MHKYANAYQTVDNAGGHSFANIWDPNVGPQIFSLSQHWYSSANPVQTVECGWQVFPQKYNNNTNPVLFIYWTADDYQATGNYNLDKPAFVQTNNSWALGGALDASITGGQQCELEILWNLEAGNWWLYLQGTTAANAVGYYPTSIFNGGQLASMATEIDYGGEVVDATSWPPMGSGAFANAGYQVAAYHRDIYFFQPGAANAQAASLQPVQQSPNCFTIATGSGQDPWNEYFYFGGPGGAGCQ